MSCFQLFVGVIKMRFNNKSGDGFVSCGDFVIASHETGASINEKNWAQTLRPGIGLDMNIVIRRTIREEARLHCPVCEKMNHGQTLGEARGITWYVHRSRVLLYSF
jgi:hypothetical protein